MLWIKVLTAKCLNSTLYEATFYFLPVQSVLLLRQPRSLCASTQAGVGGGVQRLACQEMYSLRDQGEILNIVNLPILDHLMSHIRNPRHDMAYGKMQVWLSALTELPGLHGIAQSSEDLHGFWRETMRRATGRTWQDSMSDFILCRHLQQLMPCSQRLLNYLWRVTGKPKCFFHCLFSS